MQDKKQKIDQIKNDIYKYNGELKKHQVEKTKLKRKNDYNESQSNAIKNELKNV